MKHPAACTCPTCRVATRQQHQIRIEGWAWVNWYRTCQPRIWAPRVIIDCPFYVQPGLPHPQWEWVQKDKRPGAVNPGASAGG